MSTYVKRPTSAHQTDAGRRFVGQTAAVLILVIAAGTIVAVDQWNDGSATDVIAEVNTGAAQADEMAEANNDPRHIIERQMALETPATIVAPNVNAFTGFVLPPAPVLNTGAATKANNDPRHLIERQMAHSGEFVAAPTGSGVIQEQFAHEFAAERATANGDSRNQMEGRAE